MTREALMRALGSMGAEGPDGVWASPTSERQLGELLQIVAAAGARLGRDVKLSRGGFAQVGPIGPKSGTALLGAGVRLQTAEATLREQGLTLGALPTGAWGLTLARFLEGPYAGLRAVGGGRLEPLCQSLTGVLGDGRVLATPDSPRSAAGPELMALFLGAEGRLGLVTRATVRCFPFHQLTAGEAFEFGSPADAVRALRAALSDGINPDAARLEGRRLTVSLSGTEGSLERDVASLRWRAKEHRSRAMTVVPARTAHTPDEHEASWESIAGAVESGAELLLMRLGLSSAIARGPVHGVRVFPDTPAPGGHAALDAVLDPRQVLGAPTP